MKFELSDVEVERIGESAALVSAGFFKSVSPESVVDVVVVDSPEDGSRSDDSTLGDVDDEVEVDVVGGGGVG